MSSFLQLLNPTSYQFLARVRPVLLAGLAPAMAIALWASVGGGRLEAVATTLFVVGVPYLAAEQAADMGRRRQAMLWSSCGGVPTVRLLRHRDTDLNPATFVRLRSRLQDLCPGVVLPSAELERADPEAADRTYESCIDRARVLFRSEPLVLKANISFGFRRNLWAIRRWGMLGGLGAFGAAALHVYRFALGQLSAATLTTALVAVIAFGLIRKKWVYRAGEIYARRLMEAVDSRGDR